MSNMHVGDVGTVITVEVREGSSPVDISGYTVLKISLEKPDETMIIRDAILKTDGTDGKMRITIQAGDLDLDGQWKIEGFVGNGTDGWSTDFITVDVDPVIPNDK